MTYRGVAGEVVETTRGDSAFSCEWRIPDFLSLAGEEGDRYQSPYFDACGLKWYIRIYPKGWPGSRSGSVSFILFRLDEGPSQTLDVTLGIRGAEGVESRRERRQEFSDDDDACLWSKFCSRSELRKQKSRLMPNNVLIISLDMKSVVSRIAIGVEELQKSFQRLLACGEESDVVIKVQGKEFRAHRLILRARSSVLQAMFAHDMMEKQKGEVKIEDCDPESFPAFLEHIYTGSTQMISTENAFSLYSTSDKYDLIALKEACLEFVKCNLSVSCFCDAITFAVKHEEKELINLAMEFFCGNSLAICKTVEWQIFMKENSTVANELLIKAFSK